MRGARDRSAPRRAGPATGRAAGFTLLEMLVAVGIFALVSAIAYGGLAQALTARDRVAAEREFWQTLALAFTRIEEDLVQARARPIRDSDGAELPALVGQPTDPRALARPSIEFSRGGVFVFRESKSLRSDLQRVGYRFSEGTLWRLAWPVLDRGPEAEPVAVPLLKDVEDFQARFFNPDGRWDEYWPPGAANPPPLPRGVEVTLKLKDRGEFRRVFSVHD